MLHQKNKLKPKRASIVTSPYFDQVVQAKESAKNLRPSKSRKKHKANSSNLLGQNQTKKGNPLVGNATIGLNLAQPSKMHA